jgi:FkbM family methyltransferase
MLNQLRTLSRYLSTFGFFTGLRWYTIRWADSRGFLSRSTVTISVKRLQHPLTARTKGSSDLDVFDEIFVKGELGFLSRLKRQPSPRLVIDLGANVGCASAVFLNVFPDSFVLAVEPDPQNAAMCRSNLSPYKDRVHVVEGAVWYKSTPLVLSRGTFGDGREWATEVREAQPGEHSDVVGLDMQSILRLCPAHTDIDLLKIDIEGSETTLFCADADEWLHCVRNICIEVHGSEGHLALLTALKNCEYEYFTYGQYTLCLDLKQKCAESDRPRNEALTKRL